MRRAREFVIPEDTTQDVVQDVEKWLASATPEDIGTAIILGYPSVGIVKKLKKAQSTLPKQTSVEKGQIGEKYIENILVEKFGKCNNTTKSSHSGDLQVIIDCYEILIEVKNYTGPVGTAQVDKFIADLGTTGARGGVFISLNTSIAKLTSDCVFKYEHVGSRNIPVVYCVSNSPGQITTAVSTIAEKLRNATIVSSAITNNIDQTLQKFSTLAEELSRCRMSAQADIGKVVGSLTTQVNSLYHVEASLREELNRVKESTFNTVGLVGMSESVINDLQKTCFVNYHAPIQAAVQKIILDINSVYCSAYCGESHNAACIPVWKVSTKKCQHVESGIGILFEKTPVFCIDKSKVVPDTLGELVKLVYAGKVKISNEVLLDIDDSTVNHIADLIKQIKC